MLSHNLQNAVNDLNELINMSKKDIEDIKLAQHDEQFQRRKIKEDLLKSFENRKAMIDHEISKLMTSNPDVALDKLLNEEQGSFLSDLKTALKELQVVNKHYARLVLSVSSFYNTLLERMVPSEMNGYDRRAGSTSFLEIRA